ncbi:DUF4878 domain-containing protein [Parasphingopyxis sp.]|uniref:DUF4878 domain-containing protein n=1 Tax=Parasphingopyxis sp. TaxID=1920299 RepID=UPI002634C0FE|nr:DUF4878 domain-containing protein [Parasphingopyxis sp.]
MNRILAFLAPLLLVFAAACSGGNSGPGATVEAFQTAIAEGNEEAVIEHIEPDAREMFRPKMGMIVSLASQEANRRGGFDGIEILSEEVEGDTATVRYQSNFGDGTSEEDEATLTRVDGVWYISVEME